MQASTFLEERINQAGQGVEVVLLDMYLEERDDICFVPELDQEKVFNIFTQNTKFCAEVEFIIQSLPEDARLEQLRATFLPLLMLTLEDGVFRYALNRDEYVVEVSKDSALKILEHAFQLEGY